MADAIEERKKAIRAKRAKQRAAEAEAKAAAAAGGAPSPKKKKDNRPGLKEWLAKTVVLPTCRLLGAAPKGCPSDHAEVLGSFTAPVPAPYLEMAGRSFHTKTRRAAGLEQDSDDGASSDEDDGKKKKLSQEAEASRSDAIEDAESGESLYEKLALGHLRWRATEDDVRKAYRQASLKYHPDKVQGTEKEIEKATEIFRDIQDAYEILMDVKKRRLYDSKDDFDDHVPSKIHEDDGKDFYQTFGPVFVANSRWSVTQPCPLLGKPDANEKELDRCYDFWFKFKSWREFADDDEYNVDDAQCREEKRWMERNNERQRQRLKNKENARLRKLVETAYRLDPRVIVQKEAAKKKKEAAKNAKAAARQEKADAAERKEKDAEAKKETDAREKALAQSARKREKERSRNELRSARRALRTLVKGDELCMEDEVLGVDGTETLCATLDAAALQALLVVLEGLAGEARRDALQAKVVEVAGEDAAPMSPASKASPRDSDSPKALTVNQQRAEKNRLKEEEAAKKAEAEPWSESELALLTKALKKFPGGSVNRWGNISNFVGTRTMPEVIDRTKMMKAGMGQGGKAKQWAPQAGGEAAKPTPIAERLAAAAEGKKGKKGKGKKGKGKGGGGQAADDGKASGAGPKEDSAKEQARAAFAAQKKEPKAAAKPKVAAEGGAQKDTKKPAQKTQKTEMKEWSEDEQRALERGLREFKADMKDERWKCISEMIPSRTPKECKLRYKQLRLLIKKKKQAAAKAATAAAAVAAAAATAAAETKTEAA